MDSSKYKCRHCSQDLNFEMINLGKSPPSNSYITFESVDQGELFYPLKVFVCENCFLVQVPEFKLHSEIFNDEYAYFSSYSKTWLKHAQKYVQEITSSLKLNRNSFVIEIASNDGYLLKNFKANGIPCLGIEPTKNTALIASRKGVKTITEFFTYELSKSLKKADLIVCNNVLAHVPDINDFVRGLKNILKIDGTITIEFPHLLSLLKNLQFDTIYHEHYSYLSIYSLLNVFERFGLSIYRVEEIQTHGGSLRIFVKHKSFKSLFIDQSVDNIVQKELKFRINEMSIYKNFKLKVLKLKVETLSFLTEQKILNKKIIAYGAAAKGNTFINYCGLNTEYIDFVVDRSEFKKSKFLPGSNIPILSEKNIKDYKPDYIIILPWNLENEIKEQLNYVQGWGCKFVIFVPQLKVFH